MIVRIPSGSRAWVSCLVATAAAAVVFLAVDNPWVQGAALVGTYAAAALLLLRTWLEARTRRDDLLVHTFLAGVLFYLLAYIGWYFWPLVTSRMLPAFSIVDVLFFIAYGLFAAFLVMLSGKYRTHDRRGTLDAFIITSGLAPVLWVVLVEPQIEAGLTTASITYLLYPTFVSFLLALAVRVSLVAARRTVPYVLLAGWIGNELLADLIYAQQGVAGTFTYGDAWQVLWILAAGCIGALALHPNTRDIGAPQAARRSRSRGRLPFMAFALIAPVGTLVYAEVADLGDRAVLFCAVISILLIVLVCARLSGLMVDLAEQQRLHAQLEELAGTLEHESLHDPLTGLGNRTLFRDRLEAALAQRPEASDEAAAVLLLDLDDFKAVNDTLGHDAGDRVLIEVARRLQRVTRHGEAVARLGGDEFAIVMSRAHLADALRLADRVVQALDEPFDVGPRSIRPGGSIGISFALRGQDRTELLAEADIAMYAAKARASSAPAVFDPELHREVLERHQLESDLREATAAGQLRLLYQPLVHLASNDMVGVEALVRWQHPTRGVVSPLEFIPIAEANGTISIVGDWVLEQACRQLLAWDAAGTRLPLRVSVNVSPRQLADPEFVERARRILTDTGVPPARITLEVTEAALGSDTETMIARLGQLKALGVMLAIDDFGTGYSSLSHLRRLPVDVLKIDRSFVTGIAREPAEWALTTAIVQLATSLDKITLAEGIETGGQLAHLRSLNCEYGQGYLYSKPVSAEEITVMARAQRGATFSFR